MNPQLLLMTPPYFLISVRSVAGPSHYCVPRNISGFCFFYFCVLFNFRCVFYAFAAFFYLLSVSLTCSLFDLSGPPYMGV